MDFIFRYLITIPSRKWIHWAIFVQHKALCWQRCEHKHKGITGDSIKTKTQARLKGI